MVIGSRAVIRESLQIGSLSRRPLLPLPRRLTQAKWKVSLPKILRSKTHSDCRSTTPARRVAAAECGGKCGGALLTG